ncbi:MAG: hypothetical protein CVV64_16370 [Candidatus Wallbacteria bacterium HGW-Wallbacteria-1]|jgi:signal transduction histidine kinase/CheY-like chemotaxis protein|uniref:histidine kinase n=1 Tax=Candidatus Wallbacteria bacterium HGW-Wallbacteria-1 TaxID=2013854 RepID=A0A2N1PKX7_9BACT|nr:MAG: hypothetical protein CVV64_16370 [Candidatus Wallbacteria bacterium HGW-Wallbacteria-1]
MNLTPNHFQGRIEDEISQSKASSFLIVNLLNSILTHSNNPGQFAQFITSEIRELVGAKAVALMMAPHFTVSTVAPQRHLSRFSDPQFTHICRKYSNEQSPIPLAPEDHCGNGIIIPLHAAGEPIGTILIMDLLTEIGVNSALQALESLAGVIGLVFRNTMLYKNLDNLVMERTRDLSNEVERHSQSLELLRQENIFIEKTLNSIKDTLVVFDPKSHRIIRWNNAFLEISGYSEDLLQNMIAPDEMFNKSDNELIHSHMKSLLALRETSTSQIKTNNHIPTPVHSGTDRFSNSIIAELLPREGSPIPMEFTAAPVIDNSGELLYIIVTGRDIRERIAAENERKRYEEQLRQSNKLEAIGTLAGGISHDFNNILASILGNAEVAEEDLTQLKSLSPHDHDQAAESLLQIEKAVSEIIIAGNRARDLISHILAFSRKQPHTQKSVILKGILFEILVFLRSTVPSTIQIQHNLEEAKDVDVVYGDPTQIYQILLNICTNASQAMKWAEKGVLEIHLEQVLLDPAESHAVPGLKPGPYARISISDTGQGIPAEIIDRIFDPYFTTKDLGKGCGFGLAVSMGLAKSHDGTITVNSIPERGTTFTVLLPTVKSSAFLTSSIQTDAIPHGNERILLVDDEDALVDLISRRLERLGYRVTAIRDSREALKFFKQNHESLDLLLSDQTMPGLSGDRLTAAIHRIRPGFPVIICSGYSSRLNSDTARMNGIDAYLMKPVDKGDLARTIRKVLDSVKEPQQVTDRLNTREFSEFSENGEPTEKVPSE